MRILPLVLSLSGATTTTTGNTTAGSITAGNTTQYANRCPYLRYAWTGGPSAPAYTTTVLPPTNGEGLRGGTPPKLRDHARYRVAPAGAIQTLTVTRGGVTEVYHVPTPHGTSEAAYQTPTHGVDGV